MDRLTTSPGKGKRLLPLLACVFIGLAASQPLLAVGRLPRATDSFFHLHRLIEVDALLHQGILFSRWAPHLARGFGYPLFNYYAPLSYYLPEALHLLGLSFVPALLGGFVLALVCASLAMYAWARDLLGEGPGVVAAAAYVCSPYVMVNLVTRSVFAEVFAMPLLPLLMFALGRLITTGQRRYATVASLTLAALILSHNVTAALFVPFAAIYVLAWQVGVRRGAEPHLSGPSSPAAVRLLWAACAVLAALGLTAFFWLPALAERGLVQMDRLTISPIFDYRKTLVGLDRIFSLPVLEDPHVVNRIVPHSLSLVAALLALLGALGIWRWKPSRAQAAQLGAAGLAACAAIFMITPASAQVWKLIPQMRILQFAWRFLGVASPFFAVLAGSALRAMEGREKKNSALRTALLPVLVCALLVWVFPWQDPSSFHPYLGDLTVEDVVRYEQVSPDIGTTTTGEYLPSTVKQYPPPASVAPNDGNPERLDRGSLPEGAQVVGADYRPLEYRVTIQTANSFVAVFNTFDFAGWRAWVDGLEVAITPTEPYGLISVKVPAGTHELRVSFGSTPVRIWAELVTVASSLLLVAAALLSPLRSRRGDRCPKRGSRMSQCDGTAACASAASPASHNQSPRLTPGQAWGTVGVVAIAFGLKTLYIDPSWVGYRRATLDIVSNANLANRLILMGADRPSKAVSGQRAEVVMYWRVPAAVDAEYSTTAYLVDEQGIMLAHADNQHPGDTPTTVWGTDNYARDRHVFVLPPGTPPGRYAVHVGAYPYGKPDETLDVLDANGAPAGRSVVLTTLEVVRPPRPPRENELPMQARVDRSLGADLTLLGYDVALRQVRTGEKLPLVLYWKAEGRMGPGTTVQLQLLDAAGAVAHNQSVPPVPGYDTGQWLPGDIWRGSLVLTIPARLPTGVYTLAVSRAGNSAVPLGQVDVQAPAHQFAAPPLTYAQQATFGNLARLVGYDLGGNIQPNGEITVTLVWRAEREDTGTYKTFVHLLRPDGSLLAGSDAVPGDWERPLSSWVTGEYIVDPHRLRLPDKLEPGMYRLEVGLYDSSTLQRLRLGDGADALLLSQGLGVRQ